MHKRADCHLPANYILCDQSSVCLSCTEIVYCSEICKMSGSYYRMMTPGCSKICPQALFTRKKAPLNFLLFFMRILLQCFLFCLSFLILSETLWREAWGEIHLLLVALVVCFFFLLQTTWQSRKWFFSNVLRLFDNLQEEFTRGSHRLKWDNRPPKLKWFITKLGGSLNDQYIIVPRPHFAQP